MNYYLIQALKEIELANFVEADKLCRSSLESAGTSSDAYRTLGLVYLRQQKFNEAITCLETAFALDETDFQTGTLLVQAYESASKPRDAAELNKNRLRYFPSNAEITKHVVNYYQQDGTFDQKIQGIRSFVKKQTFANPDKKQRVLFGMSFTIYPPCRVHDFLLSQSLILRGAEIIPLVCGMAQEGECNVFGGIWGGMTGDPEHDCNKCLSNCQTCMEADNKLWREWAEIEPVAVSRYVTPALCEEKKHLVAQMDLSDYRNMVFDGMPIGHWASDVIRNNYMVGDDSLVPDLPRQVRHFFFNILLMIEGCRQALQDICPNVIVSNDSYYYQWAILEELARRQNIPFYSHWQGGRRIGWCYAYNEPSMELNLSRCWPSFREVPLLPFEERIVDDFLTARPTGGTMTLNTADPTQNSDSHAIEEIDFSKPTVLLAANVIWDLAALNREVQFNDMIDWACQTIEFFRRYPHWQLIIKPHPGELNKSLPATRQLLAEEIAKRIPQLPPNVVVCSPLTQLSVYDLIPHVRFGLVFTSTVGLEMACRGMAVVTGGVSVYHDMGFTFDPPTAQGYFETLCTLMHTPSITAVSRERAMFARKFLYLYLFRYYTALNLFDHSFTDHPTLLIHDGHELMPGANDVLDYVCDTILAHQPIVSKDRLPPLGRNIRGLYNFTLQETLAAARLVIDGYSGDVHEELLEESGGMQSVRLADSIYHVPKGIFKPGELSWVFQEVVQPSNTNPHAYENNSVTIHPGDVVVDAGACAGFFTRQALAKGANKVFAFEPLPAISGALQETFRHECMAGIVVVKSIALTSSTGTASFNDGDQFICEARLTSEGTHMVMTSTLDNFVHFENVDRIDFIKMDIEGEEMNAMMGAVETINRFKPRLAIAVYHQYENAALVRDILNANCPGYTVEFGGRYMFEVPHRPYMVYAYFDSNKTSFVPANRERLKILFTTPVIEHPPASGPALRIENSIKALNQVSELHLVVRIDQESLGGPAGEAFYRRHCNAFAYTPHLTGSAKQHDEIQNAQAIVRYAEEQGIGIIWCGYGNISHPLMKAIKELRPNLKVVCDTDSVWSRFLLRELPLEKDPGRCQQIEYEGRTKEREEAEWVNFCDVTTAVSEVDADYYRQLATDPSRIHLFSNVIDLDSYAVAPPPAPDMRSPSMYLAGSFYSETCPMVRAARWIISEVLPIILRTTPNITLYIIGNGADRMLADIRHPNVTIKGKVPSVLPYLYHTDVALVPLMFESGTRFKILEAAACNVPIVSTTLGAEGLPTHHGVELLIADNPIDFANAVIRLIRDTNYAKSLASNCKQLVNRLFSINSLTEEAQSITRYLLTK
ncbi:MAG: FkbM family methyltransferase [Deltaproteobacteria bacterium]|nr:FkbM family methyltransferase [Deltaproteobacteria bacterium]